MGKLRKPYLLALLVTLGLAAACYAANTKFTNVEVTNNLTVDGTLSSANCATSTASLTVNNLTATYGVSAATITASGTTTLSGATTVSTTTFTGAFVPWPRTLAQINALLSGTTGQIVVCTDCTRTGFCQSSGTVTVGAWVVPVSTATVPAYTTLHCQ